MPISEIVKAWCKERNAKTGANRWLIALWLSILVFLVLLVQTSNLWAIAGAGFLFFIWLMFAPKPIEYSQLRTTHRNSFVCDSLLAALADAPNVPEPIKTEIANKLEQEHRVTYEFLFELEGWIEHEAKRKEVEKGSGFQKMVAYSHKNAGQR